MAHCLQLFYIILCGNMNKKMITECSIVGRKSPLKPHIYTPGIYFEGYIVFVFLFVRSYVCMLVHSSVTLTKIMSKFCVKVPQMAISQQPLIRKHSYLGHGYLGGSAYIPWILAPGSMHWGGAGGQKLGHPKKVLYCFFFYAYPFLRH